MNAAAPLCELCCEPYDPPVNRPSWARCEVCTLNPPRRGVRPLGIAPGYRLPPATLNSVTFIVPGRPASVNRTYVAGNFRYTKEARAYRSAVAAHARKALGRLAYDWDKSRRFTISLLAYFATDRSDSDNIIKPVKDALQDLKNLPGSGVLYFNDSQVVSDHTEKYVDKDCPRLVVTVTAVSEMS